MCESLAFLTPEYYWCDGIQIALPAVVQDSKLKCSLPSLKHFKTFYEVLPFPMVYQGFDDFQ